MIYLIGGSPRGGKSILSRKLSKKLNIPYLSTDNIRPIVMAYYKGKNRYKKFPFEKMFDEGEIDHYFTHYTKAQILKADLVEARTIWPGVQELIDFLLKCKMDYIIEGVHLLPNLVKRYRGNRQVKIVYLTKMDEEKIYHGIFKNKNSDWLLDNIKDKRNIRFAARSLCAYGKYFLRETKRYGYKCLNTEDDFRGQLNKAADSLRQ